MCELDAGTSDLDPLLLGDGREQLAEAPGGFLAEDAGRLAALVALDDSAPLRRDPLCQSEGSRVQPEGMEILRPQCGRSGSRDLVQRLFRRLGLPVRGAPALPADPAHAGGRTPYALQRVGTGDGPVEAEVALSERPRREVDVRVREPGDDAAAAEVDDVGRGGRSRACRPARDPVAGDGEARATGSAGSIVRTTPFSMITGGDCTRRGGDDPMIDHASVNVRDIEGAKSFYSKRSSHSASRWRWRWMTLPASQVKGFHFGVFKREPVGGAHVAFACEDHAKVNAFYEAAMAAGGKDNGAPGLRPHYHENYYGAWVHDADGNNIEAVCQKPQ